MPGNLIWSCDEKREIETSCDNWNDWKINVRWTRFLTLLDVLCLAVVLFLGFSFLPTNGPLAGLDYFELRGFTMGASE